MAKAKNSLDTNQLSIFDLIIQNDPSGPEGTRDGSFNIDLQFRIAVSEDLKSCHLSRYGVAARMSELLGREITKAQLDSWTAESKEQHRFPAVFLAAFAAATGQTRALSLVVRTAGSFILPGPDALRSEIRRIDEDIQKKQQEKRKRVTFLKEMGERL